MPDPGRQFQVASEKSKVKNTFDFFAFVGHKGLSVPLYGLRQSDTSCRTVRLDL
jgi:hypothetical protein